MTIEYKINSPLGIDEFIDLLKASGLAERRPIVDRECIAGMIENSNLTVSAWASERLVGVARSITDFHYACYLSDLAVAKGMQGAGIGKHLQILTQKQLGPQCKLILIAAPSANSYYKKLGFDSNERCWILERDKTLITHENDNCR